MPEYFGAERNEWDQDTGLPGMALFANAVQVWAVLQHKSVSVREAINAALDEFLSHSDKPPEKG